MKVVKVQLAAGEDLETAWEALTEKGFSVLWASDESDGSQLLFLEYSENLQFEKIATLLPGMQGSPIIETHEIDWISQWSQHGYHFQNGYVHIPLKDFCPDVMLDRWNTIKLMPGPGFGDLSHPTTYLMLQMMAKQVRNCHIVDLGCGSGILSLCAIAMGAQSVIGIDIDPHAIQHSQENAALNDMQQFCQFGSADILKQFDRTLSFLVLMNMIWSEQIGAWKSIHPIHSRISNLIVSGILVSERDAYLAFWKEAGWIALESKEREGWMVIHFTRNRIQYKKPKR